MRHPSTVVITASLSLLCTLTQALTASAEPDTNTATNAPAAADVSADQASPERPATTEVKPAEKSVAKAKPPVTTVACTQPKPPVYVADWVRLAELSRSDSLILDQVDVYASRHETARHVAIVGSAVGVAVALVGTLRGLFGNGWTDGNKGTLLGGGGLTVVSLLAGWAINPDRDDFLTLINHWNLRHPDLVMAP
jgi:hypothetical protein